MSSLINTRIQDTYTGLIKTADNLPVDGTLKNLEDGNGGVLPMQVSTTGVNFTGTVTGLPTVEAGLINGAGADSLISSSDLTTTPASAPLSGQIAIGNGAAAGAFVANAIAIGNNAVGGGGTAVGNGAQAFAAGRSAAYGANARSLGNESLAVGGDALVPNNSTRGVAIGDNAQVAANTEGGVALGAQVTADKANTVSVKALDIQTPSTPSAGGIIMTDAGSTERRINITATGELQIDSTPVGGGGGAAGLVNGTGTDSLKQADTLTTSAAIATGDQAVALGNGARATGPQAVALGDGAEATNVGAAAVGQYAEASGLYSSAWGRTAYARVEGSVAFGQQAGVPNDFNLAGAVAMGRGVVAVNGDTTHVRALYIVAPDGGTGGNGITMLSPNGTAYKLTVSDAGALVIAAV